MSNWSLFVKNPISDAEKSITGTLISSCYSTCTVTATVTGLPKPFTTAFTGILVIDGKSAQQIADIGEFTITGDDEYLPQGGPTSGPGSSEYAYNNLLTELSSIIDNIYGTTIGPRLVWERVPEEPKQEEPQSGTQSAPVTEPSNKQTSAIVDPKSINSKITLSVKSGPGVIIGITEKDVVNGEIDFSGLQFDKPGDYVISVTPTSPDLSGTEFSITIAPEEDVIAQDDSRGGEEKKVEGDRPIIAQINKPEIILPPIEYDITKNNQENNEIGFGLGFTPFFWYNALQIPERDIKSLELYHEGISPMVSITFMDTLGVMKGDGSPLDDTKFEVFLSSGSENLKSIHLKFKLKNFQRNTKSYTIEGSIDLPEFYNIYYKSYTGTSFDVLKTISKELKLGFNSNISNTTDSMKWSNTGMLSKDFIHNIIKHTYISDNAFMLGYIDHYWCFNYVDIEKEWVRDVSNDVGVDSQGMSQMAESKSDADKIVPLILTNDPSQRSSSLYFEKHNISNNSTHQSLEKGQFTTIKYYDINKKSMMIFNIDSLTTNKDEVISLKGAPGDEKSFEENYRTQYLGRVDMDNVHENYIYSEIQNRVNLDNLVKITADLELPQANYNLYKYQKIRVNFINMKRTETSKTYLDERMSGEWLIIDIRYTWRGGKLSQKIQIARKELNKIAEELDIPTKAKDDNVNNSEINENPVDKSPPNIVYNVGQTYKLKDKNGEIYEIVIEKLSDDGNEVVAKLTHKPYNRLEGLSSTPVSTSNESLPPDPPKKVMTISEANATSKLGYIYGTLQPNTFITQVYVNRDASGTDGIDRITTVSNSSNPSASESDLIYQAAEKAGDEFTTEIASTISYKLYITEPSEVEQKIIGDVVFRTSGPDKIAIGTLTGLPTPFITGLTTFEQNALNSYIFESGGLNHRVSVTKITESGIIRLESYPSSSASEEVLINDVISKLTNTINQIYGTNLGNRLTFEKITTV